MSQITNVIVVLSREESVKKCNSKLKKEHALRPLRPQEYGGTKALYPHVCVGAYNFLETQELVDVVQSVEAGAQILFMHEDESRFLDADADTPTIDVDTRMRVASTLVEEGVAAVDRRHEATMREWVKRAKRFLHTTE